MCKRRIDADGDQLNHLVEAFVLFAEVMSLLLANLRVQGGNHADDANFALTLGARDVHEREIGLGEFHVPQLVADIDARSCQNQRAALEEDRMALSRGRTAPCYRKVLVEEFGFMPGSQATCESERAKQRERDEEARAGHCHVSPPSSCKDACSVAATAMIAERMRACSMPR